MVATLIELQVFLSLQQGRISRYQLQMLLSPFQCVGLLSWPYSERIQGSFLLILCAKIFVISSKQYEINNFLLDQHLIFLGFLRFGFLLVLQYAWTDSFAGNLWRVNLNLVGWYFQRIYNCLCLLGWQYLFYSWLYAYDAYGIDSPLSMRYWSLFFHLFS